MNRREKLHYKLVDMLQSNSVYFQPPENVKMTYPAIVYKFEDQNVNYADDKKYLQRNRYKVTLITKDPCSEIIDKITELDFCRLVSHFTSNNLHHYIYYIYA